MTTDDEQVALAADAFHFIGTAYNDAVDEFNELAADAALIFVLAELVANKSEDLPATKAYINTCIDRAVANLATRGEVL